MQPVYQSAESLQVFLSKKAPTHFCYSHRPHCWSWSLGPVDGRWSRRQLQDMISRSCDSNVNDLPTEFRIIESIGTFPFPSLPPTAICKRSSIQKVEASTFVLRNVFTSHLVTIWCFTLSGSHVSCKREQGYPSDRHGKMLFADLTYESNLSGRCIDEYRQCRWRDRYIRIHPSVVWRINQPEFRGGHSKCPGGRLIKIEIVRNNKLGFGFGFLVLSKQNR